MPQHGSLAVVALLAAAAVLGLARTPADRRWLALHPNRGNGPDTRPRRNDATGPGESTGPGLRDPALMLELIGAALDAGSGLGRSLELVARHADPRLRRHLDPVVSALALGAEWGTAWRSSGSVPAELRTLKNALGFAAATGVPSSAILYAQAARLRREQFRAAERRAAALGVKLVVPLGLCSLPAFVCLGIVPVLLALMSFAS